MPIRESEQAKYPADWENIRARILARAGNRCEFETADGTRCDAPNRSWICRRRIDKEQWLEWPQDARAQWGPDTFYEVFVVLTIAHLNHEPADCSDENLKAGCQLHHLRHDVDHHKQTAAATRRAQKQNGELFA